MRSKKAVASLLLVSLIAVEANAQAKKDDLPPPEGIVKVLQSDDRSAKEALSVKLGFVWNESIYTQFDSIELNFAVLQAPDKQAILHATCGNCWVGFIAVLQRSDENWQRLATFVTGGKHGQPRVSLRNVIGQEETEIVIQGNEVFSGTGMWQYNLTILKLHAGRLEAIFDEAEEINFSVPSASDPGSFNTEQTQKSEFRLSPPVNDKATPLLIYEKQEITVHKKTISRWRVFYWDLQLNRYMHNPIDRPDKPFGSLRPIG